MPLEHWGVVAWQEQHLIIRIRKKQILTMYAKSIQGQYLLIPFQNFIFAGAFNP